MKTGFGRFVRTALVALLVSGCATTSPVSTNYFYVGGQYVGEGSSRKLSGHMYVQVFEPAVKKHRFPVVLVHGNSQSGNNFIGTVDGRPGWAQDFSARGYTVYVVDQVGRGRSGTFPSLYGAYGEPSISLVELLARAPDTTFPTARLNTQWPDKGVAGQPYFDQFLAQQMPSIRDVLKIEELNVAAHLALLEKIGPAILVEHSQAGVRVDRVRENGHMMMLAKNSSEVVGVTMGWLEGKGVLVADRDAIAVVHTHRAGRCTTYPRSWLF